MSNVLAIAAVTQILKDLLNDALINGEANQALDADFTVTALPPDRVVADQAADQATRLNLFLHRITPNAALRNADLPTRDAGGRLLRRPRLALDLHYILTAVASEELHAEILLGYAMQLFHEQAILPREQIRAALNAAGLGLGQVLPPGFDLLRESDLADQIELLKITPHILSMDDMSKLWTALQTSYRTTVAYDVSLVLIERELPTRPSLPVLGRGGLRDPLTGRDPGVALRPDLAIGAPTLIRALPEDGQQVMRLGGDIQVIGAALGGGEVMAVFTEPGTGTRLRLAPRDPVTATRLILRLPSGGPLAAGDPLAGTAYDPAAWRIGPYALQIEITGPDGRVTQSNAMGVTLAPRCTTSVLADPGGVRLVLDCAPQIRAGQTVAVLAGQQMQQLPMPDSDTAQVQAVFAGLTSGAEVAVRLRVDGIDSPVIDMAASPPRLETVVVP